MPLEVIFFLKQLVAVHAHIIQDGILKKNKILILSNLVLEKQRNIIGNYTGKLGSSALEYQENCCL
jgi:hypothetical protein